MKTKKNRPRDLDSILAEMLDLLMYKQVLTEETAEDYFDWLIEEGLEAVNWNLTGDNLVNELSDINTRERFNNELDREGIEDNYFESNSLSQFRKDFARKVKNENLPDDQEKKVWQMFNNYCYHFAQSVSSKTVKPNFRKQVNWTDKSKDTVVHDYPLH